MYARVLNWNGVKDIDAGVRFLRETALPVLESQRGFRGVTASADRGSGVFGVLSLWETEADRSASDSAMAKTRQESAALLGGQPTVENLEEVYRQVVKPPAAGCSLMVTRISMDPAKVEENIEFFKSSVAPDIAAGTGFCALRNMIDRQTGRGIVGSVWENEAALKEATRATEARRARAAERSVSFDEISLREILFNELK